MTHSTSSALSACLSCSFFFLYSSIFNCCGLECFFWRQNIVNLSSHRVFIPYHFKIYTVATFGLLKFGFRGLSSAVGIFVPGIVSPLGYNIQLCFIMLWLLLLTMVMFIVECGCKDTRPAFRQRPFTCFLSTGVFVWGIVTIFITLWPTTFGCFSSPLKILTITVFVYWIVVKTCCLVAQFVLFFWNDSVLVIYVPT